MSDEPLLIQAGSAGNKLFGFLLKIYRSDADLLPEDLAKIAGVHAAFVRGIERGAQAPSLETAVALLKPMRSHGRIRWMNDGEDCDLVMFDPTTEKEVAFIFKAVKRGQNTRISKTPEFPLKERIRLACLDRAIDYCAKTGISPKDVTFLAKKFEEFVLEE